MKHLKSFEATWIKHKDKTAQEHIANPLGIELENILLEIKDVDIHENKKARYFNVRRYYNNQYEIEVKYIQYTEYIFAVFLKQLDIHNIEMRIYLHDNDRYAKFDMKNIGAFYDFLTSIMEKYRIRQKTKYKKNYFVETYSFTLEELPTILEEIKDYYINLSADKYNL